MSQLATAPLPLSILSEEETMFRDAVREFAETEIKPYVSRDGRGGAVPPRHHREVLRAWG